MAMSFCLSVRLFVCGQRVLVGHWLTSAIVLATAALLSHADHGCPRCFLSPHLREICTSDGGLLVARIYAPHLFWFILTVALLLAVSLD